MLWDGSTSDWEQGDNLEDKMQEAGLDPETILSSTLWENAKQTLDQNDVGILEVGHWGVPLMVEVGHWGVPLMVFEEEPFYGQDRFDHLLWRMKRRAVL